jgi:hypothetical protein
MPRGQEANASTVIVARTYRPPDDVRAQSGKHELFPLFDYPLRKWIS